MCGTVKKQLYHTLQNFYKLNYIIKMKKLNLHFKVVIPISAFLAFTNIAYSQWTIVGELTGLSANRPQVSVVDGNTAFVTGGSGINATYKTTNGGTNWTQLNTGTFTTFWAIWAKDANTVFAGDAYNGSTLHFYKTSNGGINWAVIDSITGGNAGFRGIRFSISIPSFGIALAEGNNGDFYIYKTRDGGNTWTRTLVPGYAGYITAGHSLNVIDSLFYAFGAIVGSTSQKPPSIIITTDGGVTWNLREINLPSNSFGTRGLAFKEDKLTGVAAANYSTIISRTTNGGLNWVNIDVENNIYNSLAPSMRWIEGTNICYLSAAGSTGGVINGILKSTNGGLNWTPMTTSGIGAFYFDTKRIGANIYGYAISAVPGGGYGGNQVLKVTNMVVGVNQISEVAPEGYSLSQNYPNPFNPKTVINYQLSMFNFISLKVYDILGNEVATLVNEKQNAGTYEVDFDGSNFSSGVYFYKLAVDGNIIDSKRMVLLK